MEHFPPLVVGGSVFNYIYNLDPLLLPACAILDLAFQNGFNAVDSSPYYGPLEEYFGAALAALAEKWPRSSYYICTKAGRYGADDFDYSRARVRASVNESLRRFKTTYLDLVYMHDIEFVSEAEVLGALRELRLLKDEGLIRGLGVSGYPVELLYKVALASRNDPSIGPLDAVLLYSNGCLQNTRLFDLESAFFDDCGIKRLMNGSILSMSLLRVQSTHEFHPAPPGLKSAAKKVAKALADVDVDIADLATRFAVRKTLYTDGQLSGQNSIVLGVSSVQELESAIRNYRDVELLVENKKEEQLYEVVREMFGDHFNERWDSGRIGKDGNELARSEGAN